MKYLCFCVVLLAGCGPDGCQNAGGGTVARKPTAYHGNPTATTPYLETGKIYLRDMGCQGNLCDQWAGLRPIVHNPLNRSVKVKISCRYWLDGAEFKKANPTKSVEVVGPASRQFEGFDILFDAEKGLQVGLAARCTAEFDGYPASTSDASN